MPASYAVSVPVLGARNRLLTSIITKSRGLVSRTGSTDEFSNKVYRISGSGNEDRSTGRLGNGQNGDHHGSGGRSSLRGRRKRRGSPVERGGTGCFRRGGGAADESRDSALPTLRRTRQRQHRVININHGDVQDCIGLWREPYGWVDAWRQLFAIAARVVCRVSDHPFEEN